MILQPINDNIVVELPEVEKEEKTQGGIYIPTSGQQQIRSDRGEVVAVGEGRITADGKLIPLRVKEGNTILFNKFAGTEIAIGEKRYLIIKECDILAIVK